MLDELDTLQTTRRTESPYVCPICGRLIGAVIWLEFLSNGESFAKPGLAFQLQNGAIIRLRGGAEIDCVCGCTFQWRYRTWKKADHAG